MPELDLVQNLKAQVDAADEVRKTRVARWQRNVDARKNKVFETDVEYDMVAVPVDWNRTRNKTAQLFFQVPKISLFPRAPQWRPFTAITTAVLNYQLQEEIKASTVVEEVLGDVINAAGVGAVYVSYEAEFEDAEVPQQNIAMRTVNELVSMVKGLAGAPVPTKTVKKPIYQKVEWTSIDPADFLYPLTFPKINWNKAPWLGHHFTLTKAEAIRKGWLQEGERVGSDDVFSSVNADTEKHAARSEEGKLRATRIWYRPYLFDPAEKDCRKIKVIVWLEGKKEPVQHDDFPWQKYVPETKGWVGHTNFPIKPLTLNHISGQAVPPSETEIGRGIVMELNRSRTQMMQQREHSKPIRWYDVNLVDEEIVEQIRRGTWNDMIPTQGPGGNAIGEVARASYPRENWDFDRVLNHDIDEVWSMSANQGGAEASGTTSATEAEIVQQNFSVGLEHQRAKVLAWFLECAEATLDYIQMFFEIEQFVPFTKPGGEQVLEMWDRHRVPGRYVFSARPDAAVRIDVSQKRANSLNVYKLLRRDELVNPQYLVAQVFEAHDMDPAEAFAPPPPPQEQKPKPPSFSFKGEDLANALVVALVQKATPITPADIQAARLLMADVGIPVAPASTVVDPQKVDTGGAPEDDEAMPMNGKNPGHPGLSPEVTPINQRFSENGSTDLDQGMVGEGSGVAQ